MPKKTIILVHGMGTHPKGNMKSEFISSVNNTAKLFNLPFLNSFDINKQPNIKIKEFNYHDFMEERRKEMADTADAGKLLDLLSKAGNWGNIVQKILSEAGNLDEDNFFNTHWLDVFIYTSTRHGAYLRLLLQEMIHEAVKEHNDECYVIAHSLGTAISHDALNDMYTSHPHVPRIDGLITLANVSRMTSLLSLKVSPEESNVHTGSGGCINNFYLNVRNKLDPFLVFKPFYETNIGDTTMIEQSIQKKKKPHDFSQYIADPEVVAKILRELCFELGFISRKNIVQANNEYRSKSINKHLELINKQLETLKGHTSTPDDFLVFINTVTDLYKSLDDIFDEE